MHFILFFSLRRKFDYISYMKSIGCLNQWFILVIRNDILSESLKQNILEKSVPLNVLYSLACHLTLNAFDNDMFLAFKFNLHIVINIEIYCAWSG